MALCHDNNSLYLFGGQNKNAETVNDFWCYSLTKDTWTKLKPGGEVPSARSGHTFVVIGKFILLFGGLIEITKECNETFRYCI
jgi:N-acetylneuraminic acid mutarotase